MTNQSKGQKLGTWSWNQWQKKKKISEKGKTKRRLLNRFSEMQGNRVVRPFSHLPPLEDDWYSFLNWLGRSLRLFRLLSYLNGSALRFLILSQDPKPFFPFSFPSISRQTNTIIRKLQNKNKKFWTYGEPLDSVWNFAGQKLLWVLLQIGQNLYGGKYRERERVCFFWGRNLVLAKFLTTHVRFFYIYDGLVF